MTNYERISYLKKVGVWDDIVVPLTAKLSTLDRFFKIYSYIKEGHNYGENFGKEVSLYNHEILKFRKSALYWIIFYRKSVYFCRKIYRKSVQTLA